MEEIRERSLLYRGLKHYFIVRFPQRAGALRSFITDVVGPKDDINHFSYTKKTSKERGPVVIGIESTVLHMSTLTTNRSFLIF